MSLSEPFIRRPVMTVVLTVSAILFGVLAYRSLPVNDLPAVDYPVIQVPTVCRAKSMLASCFTSCEPDVCSATTEPKPVTE